MIRGEPFQLEEGKEQFPHLIGRVVMLLVIAEGSGITIGDP